MSDRYIPQHRRIAKARGHFNPEDVRRRRQDQQVEIRRQKREDNLAKRRGIGGDNGPVGVGADSDEDNEDVDGFDIEAEVSHFRCFAWSLSLPSIRLLDGALSCNGQ